VKLSSRSAARVSWATEALHSYLVGDSQRTTPSCPCFSWPKGGPPQSHGRDYSSIRHGAIAEDLHPLRPSTSQRRCSKWSIPGSDGADTDVEKMEKDLVASSRLSCGFLLQSCWS
jgi:hypothetical protein